MTVGSRVLRAACLALALGLLSACASQPKNVSSERFQTGKEAYLAGDYSNAFELLLPEAEAGNAEAQYTLGFMYYQGLGVRQDDTAALRWIQRSAQAGNDRAIDALGQLAGMGARQRDEGNEAERETPSSVE